MNGNNPLDQDLFPHGLPKRIKNTDPAFELYRMMVDSSEKLVARRQGVNTFFLTINGAILTALGIILNDGPDQQLQAVALMILTITGGLLALAWRSLIISFGQLNTGKFKVINRIEQFLPIAIYRAEWKALGEGRDPKLYRSFTSREVWAPWAFIIVYAVFTVVELLVVLDLLILQ